MSTIGDNDDQNIAVFDTRGDLIAGVEWREARERIASLLQAETSNAGWAHTQAEKILCAAFTGRASNEDGPS